MGWNLTSCTRVSHYYRFAGFPCISHRMPAAVLKPGNHVGPYRPQTGFTPPDQSRSYSSPQSTQRFVRSALSDPQSRSPYDEYGRHGMEPSSAWQPGPPMGHYQQQDPYYSTPYRHGYSDDYYGPTKGYSSSRQGTLLTCLTLCPCTHI